MVHALQQQTTERDAIRAYAAKALPGKAIAVLDQSSKLVTDIFLVEDCDQTQKLPGSGNIS